MNGSIRRRIHRILFRPPVLFAEIVTALDGRPWPRILLLRCAFHPAARPAPFERRLSRVVVTPSPRRGREESWLETVCPTTKPATPKSDAYWQWPWRGHGIAASWPGPPLLDRRAITSMRGSKMRSDATASPAPYANERPIRPENVICIALPQDSRKHAGTAGRNPGLLSAARDFGFIRSNLISVASHPCA